MKHSTPVIGSVKFNVDDRIVVADPCYIDTDDGDADQIVDECLTGWEEKGKVFDDCAGDWTAEIDVSNGYVSVLRARRDGFPQHYSREYVGTNGVDSGQMYVGGVENLPLDYDRVLACYKKDPDLPFGHENWEDHDIIAPEGGAVSSTGYGDGAYSVYVKRAHDGRPVCVEVHFQEENEEEDIYG